MSDSSPSSRVLPTLPPEILSSTILAECEEQDLMIKHTVNLPQNGQARSNRFLASVVTMDRGYFHFFKRLTWKRVGIKHDVRSLGIPELEDLVEKFSENKSHTDILEMCLSFSSRSQSDESGEAVKIPASATLGFMTRIFEIASPDRIREAVLAFNNQNPDKKTTNLNSNEFARLMLIIPSFNRLLIFKFLTGEQVHVSESFLGSIIGQLPHLQVIILCVSEHSRSSQNEVAGGQELGKALASLQDLKSLNIRFLVSLDPTWLTLEWRCRLQELTVQLRRRSALPRHSLVSFFHIFHQSLISLYSIDLLPHFTAAEKDMMLDFVSLRHVTFQGVIGTVSDLSLISFCPNVRSLTWILGKIFAEESFDRFLAEIPPGEDRWKSLERINIPSSTFEFWRGGLQAFEAFETNLRPHNVELLMLEFESCATCVEAVTKLNSRLYPQPAFLNI